MFMNGVGALKLKKWCPVERLGTTLLFALVISAGAFVSAQPTLEPRPEMADAIYVDALTLSSDISGFVSAISVSGFEQEPELLDAAISFAEMIVEVKGLRLGGVISADELQSIGVTFFPPGTKLNYADSERLEQVRPLEKWSEYSPTHSNCILMSWEKALTDYDQWFETVFRVYGTGSNIKQKISQVIVLIFEVKDVLSQDYPEIHFLIQLDDGQLIAYPSNRAGRTGRSYPVDPASIPPEVLAEARLAMGISNPAPENTSSTPPPPPNAARESSMPRYLLIGGGLLMVLGVFSLIFTRRGG